MQRDVCLPEKFIKISEPLHFLHLEKTSYWMCFAQLVVSDHDEEFLNRNLSVSALKYSWYHSTKNQQYRWCISCQFIVYYSASRTLRPISTSFA